MRRGIREDINEEKIRLSLKSLKNNKAMGIDGIPTAIWKYGGKEMIKWVWGICNRIWKGKVWMEE